MLSIISNKTKAGVVIMNIAAYCRVSTDKEDQLNSLEAQKKFFYEYTNRTGDNLVKLYADEGISGTKTKNRKQFLQMISDAENGLFQMVVVKDISRFSRNTVDLLQSIRKLKSFGIETQFLTTSMTSMGNSEFVLTLFAALAQEESANTSKRVKFGKKINAEKGRVPNIAYGYNKIKGDYFNLTINHEEALVVKQIYDLYLNKGFGTAKIANALNEQGIKTKRGYSWTQNAVRRILTNELYTGKIINGKEEISDFLTGNRAKISKENWLISLRPELKIIDEETFIRAKAIMNERNKKFKIDKTRHSNKHLFSTLISCKNCGWSFRRDVRHYKNTYTRWICSGHNVKGADSCPNAIAINEAELKFKIEQYFAKMLSQKKDVMKIFIKKLETKHETNDDCISLKKEILAEIKRHEQNRKRYIDMYADGIITKNELNDNITQVKNKIEQLKKELNTINLQLDGNDILHNVLLNSFKKVEDICNLKNATNAELKKIINKIEIDNAGNVEIILNSTC